MVETAISTGLRWGELIALKPRHLDLIKRTLSVEKTVVEVSIKNSPTGARMLTKPYPKDNEPRTMELPPATAPRSPGTPSAPGSGCQPSERPDSISRSASTICTTPTPTPPGSSPEAPTSNP